MPTNPQLPLLADVGVLALVPDRWGSVWMDRHHVLSRLASYFHVVWMYQPGWRECLSQFVKRHEYDAVALAEKPGALYLYEAPFWLPRLGRPAWVARSTTNRRLRDAVALLRQRGCTKIVSYIWELQFADALSDFHPDLSVYNISDEYSFSKIEVPISPAERKLLQSVDQVFIISPGLMEKKGHLNPHTDFAPCGVDYWKYAQPLPEPEDLRSIPRPRIGYLGHLKAMLDWNLLLELSAAHPQWSFVFVGPRSRHPEIHAALDEMSRRPNVHLLGGKPAPSLGSYVQHFDVCIMPYALNAYTNYIYPGKMHEYLASGNPVVSAPIRSVQEFRNVIAVANSRAEWSSAIERALSPAENSPRKRAERQKVAREHDWDAIVENIARIIATRLNMPVPVCPLGN